MTFQIFQKVRNCDVLSGIMFFFFVSLRTTFSLVRDDGRAPHQPWMLEEYLPRNVKQANVLPGTLYSAWTCRPSTFLLHLGQAGDTTVDPFEEAQAFRRKKATGWMLPSVYSRKNMEQHEYHLAASTSLTAPLHCSAVRIHPVPQRTGLFSCGGCCNRQLGSLFYYFPL